MLALIVVAVAVCVRATVPEYAVLIGPDCTSEFAAVWVAAAQEEAVRNYHTLNGAWLKPECCNAEARGPAQRVPPFEVNEHLVLCIAHDTFPTDDCANKKCDFESHPELYEDDCTEVEDDEDDESCRTLESWLAIAESLLFDALEYTEQCEWDLATSAACAAEFVYRAVNEHILATYNAQAAQLRFINAEGRANQRYRHINSPLRTVTFDQVEYAVQVRVVQSVRTCGECEADGAAHTSSLIVHSRAPSSANLLETSQLVWALAGVLANFATVLPFAPLNECGLQHVATNLALFDPARRVPALDAQDWATVRLDGEPRTTTDLRIAAVCPVVLLFGALVPSVPADDLPSLAHVQLRVGFAPLAPLAAAQLIEGALAFRVATGVGGECHDYPLLLAQSVYENCTAIETPVVDATALALPLTLAPGTSRCVGGTADGRACNAVSECGAGLACRRKPFAPNDAAYCYDGLTWLTSKPCTHADRDDSCPFGDCVGAVNGFDGGRFPLLHFHQEANCASDASSPVCSHDAIANWHQYPNLALLRK